MASNRGEESARKTAIAIEPESDVVVIEDHIDIAGPPERVFDYCADLTHEPEWNPKMKSMKKFTPGLVGLGTRYRAEFVSGGPMIINCARFDRPREWATVGQSTRLQAAGKGRVQATRDGTRLTLRMELEPHGLLALTRPFLRRYMLSQLQRDLGSIKARLEG